MQAERTGNDGPSQRRRVSALLRLPTGFLPVPSAAEPAQTVISLWTALSKRSSVLAGQPRLLKTWSGARVKGVSSAPFLPSGCSLEQLPLVDVSEVALAGLSQQAPPAFPSDPLQPDSPLLPQAPGLMRAPHPSTTAARVETQASWGFHGALACWRGQALHGCLWKAGGKVCFDRHVGFANLAK